MRGSGYLSASAIGLSVAFLLPLPVLTQPQPQVSPDRTDDVAVAPGEDPLPLIDDFSWRAFIALNWPALTGAAHRGQPDRSKRFGDPGVRVWETWKARYEVFALGAPKPAEWNSYNGSNPCGGVSNETTKTLSAFSHFADFNQATFTLGPFANPLVALARSVSFERTSATTSKKSAPKSDLQKTVLDDHPSISALARFLREVNGR